MTRTLPFYYHIDIPTHDSRTAAAESTVLFALIFPYLLIAPLYICALLTLSCTLDYMLISETADIAVFLSYPKSEDGTGDKRLCIRGLRIVRLWQLSLFQTTTSSDDIQFHRRFEASDHIHLLRIRDSPSHRIKYP